MKLSTRSRYGLRALCYMAENEDKGYISLSEISTNLDLPESYLEQIIRILKKHNLVTSTRGPKGGYMLSKAIDKITVGQVIRVLEGQESFSGCMEGGTHCDDRCNAYYAFHKLDEAINNAIDSITLENMVNQNSRRINEKVNS